MSSGAPRFGVVPVLCNRVVWQSSDMTYPAVNNPNITSGFTLNKHSVSLASDLHCFVVLRPLPEQSAPSAARYIIIIVHADDFRAVIIQLWDCEPLQEISARTDLRMGGGGTCSK